MQVLFRSEKDVICYINGQQEGNFTATNKIIFIQYSAIYLYSEFFIYNYSYSIFGDTCHRL